MNKKIFVLASIFLCFSIFSVAAQTTSAEKTEKPATEATFVQKTEKATSSVKYIAAALAVGFGCIGGGMAVAKIGSAAMGAMSENAELSGKALPYVGLAEGICLWGFLVGLLIIVL